MQKNLLYGILVLSLFSCNRPIAHIEIEAGDDDREHVPVTISLNKAIDMDQVYHLYHRKSGKSYPVQIISEEALFTLIDKIPMQETMLLELKKGEATEIEMPKIKLEESSDGVQVSIGDKPLLFYQTAVADPGSGLPDYYKRSGFIHPLHSPGGQILTDAFPVGHVHQHAIFNAWVNTTFKGKKVDFWNQQHELGTVDHQELTQIEEGTVTGKIGAKLSHISLEDGEVLEENWQITIYPISDFFLFDIHTEQTNTSTDTLFLNEYIYGGMAFRGSKEWNNVDSLHFTNHWKILTNEGYSNENANNTKAQWVDASGTVNGQETGLTVFGFPDNFRAPQTVRVHPVMPYWVYSPVIEGAFHIAPGQKYQSRYRYYVHNGPPDKKAIENIERNLLDPVIIRVR